MIAMRSAGQVGPSATYPSLISVSAPVALAPSTGAFLANAEPRVEVNELSWWLASGTLMIGILATLLWSKELMSPVDEDQSFRTLGPVMIVWISISGGLIFFNKMLFVSVEEGGYGFPQVGFLLLWHMVFATFFTNLIRLVAPSLMPGVAAGTLEFRQYVQSVFPVGLALSGSLYLGNAAYLYLSVAYIQMLKALTSLVVYLFACFVGQERLHWGSLSSVILIVGGAFLASVGEIGFNLFGLFLQVGAILMEAFRLVMMKSIMAAKGLKLDPLSGLYYYAPTGLLGLIGPFLLQEFHQVPWDRAWALRAPLLANGLVAFSLHLSILVFLKRAAGTTFAVTGIAKDVLLCVSSAAYFRHPITAPQIVGYGISLYALNAFNFAKERSIERVKEKDAECKALLRGKANTETESARILEAGEQRISHQQRPEQEKTTATRAG